MTSEGWLLRQLSSPKTDFRRVVARVMEEPPLIATLIGKLNSDTARVKFGSSKALRLLSEKAPQLLYPKTGFFVEQLDCPNSFLRWDATRIIANLAPADHDGKVDAILEKYLDLITGPQMVGAATAIGAAPVIARAKPHLAGEIARGILRVSRARYRTDECRNIAIGHAIQSLDRFFDLIENPTAVLEFVREQLRNPRPATHTKAERFLKARSALQASVTK